MFFVASKVIGFLLTPSNFLVLCVACGALLLGTRFVRAGRRLVFRAAALLLICGLSPLGNWLIWPLEHRFPPWTQGNGAPPRGVIVLGGGVEPLLYERGPQSTLNEAAERVTAVVDLARRYPDLRIILSGGDGALIFTSRHSESETTVALLESLGVARERITIEDDSRTTSENADFVRSATAAKPGDRWLLVTSASHMPRAVGVFRKAGLAVEAYPVDYRTPPTGAFLLPFRKITAGLSQTDAAVHEWLGLVAYRLSGRVDDIFPAP
ncbi:MAG: YdcF family protein [Variibacter sp.]